MKALHLTDLHLTEGRRLADQEAVLRGIVEHGVRAQVDVWLLTGDLTGRTVPHRATPAERLVLYEALAAMCAVAPVVIVPGNHDEARDLAAARHVGVSIADDGCWPVHVLDGAGSTQIATPAGELVVYWLAYPTKRWLLQGLEVRGLRETQAAVERRLEQLFELWSLEEAARVDPSPSVFVGHLAVAGGATSGGEVLASHELSVRAGALAQLGVCYGALGHLHLRQEVAPRVWYAGSPWRTDFGEREPAKVVHLVELVGSIVPAKRTCHVDPIETGCRWLEALDYRWSAATEDGTPGWSIYPSAEQLARVVGAEVRARLVVPEQHVASAPWEDELERLRRLGAAYVQAERVVEPVLRVRAPEVAQALDLPSQLRGYWRTLATDVVDGDAEVALELLGRLETLSDEEIAALP